MMSATPDSMQALLDSITPDIHEALKSAVETGRWANGERLTPQQLEHSLQAIIAWEARHLPEEQRVGYIDTSGLQKSHCDEPGHSHAAGDSCASEPRPLLWAEQDKVTRH
ncbi:MAG: hypothetical protein RL572_1883 [Pseudomonadota bacterium]|jgi:uncharacterized protein YeaC (DUF1315 family)